MTGNEIREKFLSYFEKNGHRRVRSSSLVPTNDPTLLFTNAGMNQFKDVFLGLEQRDYRRATSCQKCVRAGGKHNDLENVGFTNRHHTFFEMLGNFSFGDYFKKEAIAYAWELVTSKNCFGIDPKKLYVTIFKGESGVARDEEAYKCWLSQGVAKNRIHEAGMKDNFWAMGDTGPSGPCSEIHYDMGPAASDLGHKDCKFGCDCGRYVEIWNLVFMQFNRDASGALQPLPRPSVDTGAGLERLAAVLQGKISNFDTDLFEPLIGHASQLTGAMYGAGPRSDASLRIIADHSRAATFLIADGVTPSNEGHGYVLRKIVRRACDFGRQLERKVPFLYVMSGYVVDLMKEAYPDVLESKGRVAKLILSEEEKYLRLIVPAEEQLIKRIESRFAASPESLSTIGKIGLEHGVFTPEQVEKAQARVRFEPKEGRRLLRGEDLFYAYSTLGLRPDHVRDIAAARGWFLPHDIESEFQEQMAQERARAKASWKGAAKEVAKPVYAKLAATFRTEPDFYFGTTARDCRIEAIVSKSGEAKEIKPGEEAEVVLDRTSVYAESGGQVADTGGFFDNRLSQEVAEVRGAYYPVSGLIAHRIVAKENLRVGDRIATVAAAERRAHNMRNHTATHLVHAALRNILGTHVKQAGSLVAPDHLRFDFSHFAALDPAELTEIEQQVNEEITRNAEIRTDIMNLDDALASGALAFFGDKYPEQNVRVVTIPEENSPRGFYSRELCGGTHVVRCGEIGIFKIIAEQSTAAGVRRVEAITGDRALAEYQRVLASLRQIASLLNAGEDEAVTSLERQLERTRQLEKQLESLKRQAARSMTDTLLESVRTVKEVRVLASRVSGLDREGMRQLVDALRQKLGSGVVVLGSAEDGKVALVAGVTKDLTEKLHAGKIIQDLARQVGGSGGGRPDLAEAGGKDTSALEKALDSVLSLLDRML